MLAASFPVSGQSPGSCGDSVPPSYSKDVAGSPAICHTKACGRRGSGLRMESRSVQPPWAWREHTPWTPVTAPLPEASRRLKGAIPQHLPKRLRWAVQTRKEGRSGECTGLSSTCTRSALGDGPPSFLGS